jgi:hypothetical protein
MAGQPLALDQSGSPFRFLFSGWKGDWKARYQSHRLLHYYSTGLLCDQCVAVKPVKHHRPVFLYSDFPGEWRNFCFNYTAFLQRNRTSLTPWVIVPGFHHTRILWDLMHCFHMGAAKDMCAAIIIDWSGSPCKICAWSLF